MSKTVKYTRITLKKLVFDARQLGINVEFTTDMDGYYVITHKATVYAPALPNQTAINDVVYRPDTCAMAHWLITGMMAQARSSINQAMALSQTR
jgi:hypothetical protein